MHVEAWYWHRHVSCALGWLISRSVAVSGLARELWFTNNYYSVYTTYHVHVVYTWACAIMKSQGRHTCIYTYYMYMYMSMCYHEKQRQTHSTYTCIYTYTCTYTCTCIYTMYIYTCKHIYGCECVVRCTCTRSLWICSVIRSMSAATECKQEFCMWYIMYIQCAVLFV